MDGDIVFDHVSFRYETGPDVLSDVSFAIPAGSSFGILGGTGSGKSSLLLLLCRLYAPSEGRVMVGGEDLADMPAAWVRDHVGVVLQEPFLFSRTIEENIGICGADRETVRKAAATACIASDIEQFANGYDTMVGERGVDALGRTEAARGHRADADKENARDGLRRFSVRRRYADGRAHP